MIKPSILVRGALGIVVSLLVVGTVFAVGPALGDEPESGRTLSVPAARMAEKSAKPSESPEATETPEPAEATETSEPAETPEPGEASDTTVSGGEAARYVAKLEAAGITVSAADFEALAAKVGVGGAVRTFAFAKASGTSAADIVAMFQGGKGWGEIAHARGLHPGIGWIMGGGHGKGDQQAAGPAKTKGSDDSDD